MTQVQFAWFKRIQEYYRDEYPEIMMTKILQMLPTDPEKLSALSQTLIHNVSAQFRTIPDVQAVQKALIEVEEAYPEFQPHSYNRQIKHNSRMIEEDAGFIPQDVWAKLFEKLDMNPDEMVSKHKLSEEANHG